MSIFRKATATLQHPLSVTPEDPPWLDIAKGELGVAETPGNEDNPRIVEYFRHTSLGPSPDSVAWCGAFANYCMDKGGYNGTRSAAARSWLNWGVILKDFTRGAVCVFSRGDDPSLGHVGFAMRDLGDEIEIISGNSSNMVRIGRELKSRLLGYRWPS